MANTSARTLRLLSLLQNHRYWPGPELADRLQVSVRTLRRDIDRLRELGYWVDAQRGVDGGYQLAAGSALPPLVIDDDEAVALAVGLQVAVQDASVAGLAEASVRALTKVIQVMPARLRKRVDALRSMTVPATWGGSGPTVDAQVLIDAAQLCRDDERAAFSYTAASGARTERELEPHRLVLLGRRWYLVAYDLTRHDWRSFRVDRIHGWRSTGERFHPRRLPGGDAAAFVREGIESQSASHQVVALLHASADTIRASVGRWGTVEEVADDRCRLHMVADALEWPIMALGATGVDFEVESPPELVEELRAWTARFASAVATSTD